MGHTTEGFNLNSSACIRKGIPFSRLSISSSLHYVAEMCTPTRTQVVSERSSVTPRAKLVMSKAAKAAQVPREPFQTLPPRTYMLLVFAVSFYVLTVFRLWAKLAVFYAITWTLNPFSEWSDVLFMLKVTLTQPHKDIPFLYNTYGFFYIFWKAFYCYPLETILWYLDDFLFPDYRTTEIKEPLFLLGQPRSGTTMFESLLSEDSDRHCSMYLYEMRYPYLTIQYLVDFVSYLDKEFWSQRGYHFLLNWGFLSCLQETGERKNMRRLRYDLPDEDDLVFFFHTFCHFLLAGFFPHENVVRFNHRFSELPHATRMRYMNLHRKTIQKVMYRRGYGKRYLAKWVAGWNGQLDEAKIVYPDAKYVVIVRDPKESLRSWMKLQGLLAYQFTGNNVLHNHPEIRETIIQENVLWFHKEIEFCRNTSRENLLVLRYTDIVSDIPQQVKCLYQFLGQYIEIGSKFHNVLLSSKRKQQRHKKTRINPEDELITEERIESDFPNLLREIEFSCLIPSK